MKLKNRSCPICHSTDNANIWLNANVDESRFNEYSFASRKIPEDMHFQMLQCLECDVLYTSPAPESEWLNQAYSEASYDSNEEATYAAKTYSTLLKNKLPFLTDRVGALDIGTGNGSFLSYLLKEKFTNVSGIEPSKSAVDNAASEIKSLIRIKTFKEDDYDSESFSLISCFQTIEHLEDPQGFCESARKLLKKNGILFLVGHNYRSFLARFLGKKSPIYDVEHLQIYSPKSFRLMLNKLGFKDITIFPYTNTYPLSYWLKMLPLPTPLKTFLLSGMKYTLLSKLPIPIPVGNVAVFGIKQ